MHKASGVAVTASSRLGSTEKKVGNHWLRMKGYVNRSPTSLCVSRRTLIFNQYWKTQRTL